LRAAAAGARDTEKKSHAYLLDNTNGATMLTIPVGHALAGLQAVLGDVEEVSAVLATRRSTALVVDSGEKLPVTAPDQVLVSGVLTVARLSRSLPRACLGQRGSAVGNQRH